MLCSFGHNKHVISSELSRRLPKELLDFVQSWINKLPKNATHIIESLNSNVFKINIDGFFELILFALFTSLKFNISYEEVIDDNSRNRPDFLITDQLDQSYIIEAITSNCKSDEYIGLDKVYDGIITDIQKLDIPNVLVDVEVITTGHSTPSSRHVKGAFCSAYSKWKQSSDSSPRRKIYCNINKSGWELSLTFEGPPSCPTPFPLVLKTPLQMDIIRGIRNALDNKLRKKKYFSHPLPFIIAINILHEFFRDEDAFFAFYGKYKTMMKFAPDTFLLSEEYKRIDGGLFGKYLNSNIKLSGILLFYNLHFINIRNIIPQLYIHPTLKAIEGFPQHLFQTHILENQHISISGNQTLGELLKLPKDFPSL